MNKGMFFIGVSILCLSASIFFSFRYKVVSSGEFMYIYDSFNNSVDIANRMGKKRSESGIKKISLYDRYKNKVHVKSSYDESICSKEYPVKIDIDNDTDQYILYSEWKIDINKNNESSNLSKDKTCFIDKIINPHSELGLCFRLPQMDIPFDRGSMSIHIYDFEPTFSGVEGGNSEVRERFNGRFNMNS